MKRSRARLNRKLIAISIFFIVIVGYVGVRYLFPAQSPEIFVVTETDLQLGDNTVSGTLRHNDPDDPTYGYTLITGNGLSIELDLSDAEIFLGQVVTVNGVIYMDELGNYKMYVDQIQSEIL